MVGVASSQGIFPPKQVVCLLFAILGLSRIFVEVTFTLRVETGLFYVQAYVHMFVFKYSH